MPNKDKATTGGLLLGVTAGLIWGLAFPIPELLDDWTPVTLTAGRYLCYGALSAVLFVAGGAAIRDIAKRHWRLALLYAVTGNIGYYLLVVIGIHAAGAPLTTMVIGCMPITVALLGNWADRTFAWRHLLLPVSLVAAGLIVVNEVELARADSGETTLGGTILGIIAAFGGLFVWASYGVSNARFLVRNPEVSAGQWSTVIGVATGAITLLALPLVAIMGLLGPTGGAHPGFLGLLVGSMVLGMLVSWAATACWNTASTALPTALAGMLVVVETISGVTYVYLARGQWPLAPQLVGFAAIVAGVLVAMRGSSGRATTGR